PAVTAAVPSTSATPINATQVHPCSFTFKRNGTNWNIIYSMETYFVTPKLDTKKKDVLEVPRKTLLSIITPSKTLRSYNEALFLDRLVKFHFDVELYLKDEPSPTALEAHFQAGCDRVMTIMRLVVPEFNGTVYTANRSRWDSETKFKVSMRFFVSGYKTKYTNLLPILSAVMTPEDRDYFDLSIYKTSTYRQLSLVNNGKLASTWSAGKKESTNLRLTPRGNFTPEEVLERFVVQHTTDTDQLIEPPKKRSQSSSVPKKVKVELDSELDLGSDSGSDSEQDSDYEPVESDPQDLPGAIDQFIRAKFAIFSASKFKMVGDTFVIQTTDRRCTIAGREHSSNHQYLVVDSKGSIERRCHNSSCNQKPATQKETLPAELFSLLFKPRGHEDAIKEHEENVVECLGDLSNLTREHLSTDNPKGNNMIVSKILKDWNGLSKHQKCGSNFVAVSSPAGVQIQCEGCGKCVPPIPIPIDQKYTHLVQFFSVNIVNNFYNGAELEPQGKSWVGPKAKLVLEYAHQHGFLRASGSIYKRIHKWAIVQFERKGEPCDYKGFVNMVFEDDQMRLWEQAGVVSTLAKNMEDTDSKYFPLVHRNPQYVAFNNGVWDLKSLKFHPLDSPGPGDIIAGHYLNFDFPDGKDWKNLETPVFDEVVGFQLTEPEVAYWFTVLIGRLQYIVKQYDAWQVMPFLQGAGGTGKSTVLAVIQAMFANDQLGNVGSRHEASFGLMGLYTKRVVIAPDIPANISSRLPDGDFKTMVTGDPMSVAIKYKDPINIPNWEPPMIWAGNTYPDYQDVGGAISRRIAKFEFNNIVTKTNGTLVSQILDSELGNLYVKCVSRYRHEATNHQRGRFVDFAPQYFRYANLEVTEALNSFAKWLNGDAHDNRTDFGTVYLEDCPGNVEWVANIKLEFERWCRHKGEKHTPKWESVRDKGFEARNLTVLKLANVCKKCEQLARGKPNLCCDEYGPRTKKDVVQDVKLMRA
ncbi:hypothetical protein HK102_006389, partial [Quaeritorhiza haematococci]